MITKEYGEIEGRSSAFAAEWSALGFAEDLIKADVDVLRIEGVGEESSQEK